MYLSAGSIIKYFWASFWYIRQCHEKPKTFSWYFARMSWYYCGGHWTKMYWTSLSLWRFLLFLVHFVPCSSISREPSNIFIRNFVYLSFSKYKVITAVTTEVENTLLHAYLYAYLYVSFMTYIYLQSYSIIMPTTGILY